MFAVTVTFVVKEEFVEKFAGVMKTQAHNSLTLEEGCRQFDICLDPEDRRRVFLYEIYTDKSAFEVHLKTAHFITFDATVKDWLISKEAEFWERQEV